MESAWFLFWWCPLLSVDFFHKVCLSGTPSENSQVEEILGIGWPEVIGLMRNESIPWEVMPEIFKCSVREFCSRNEVAPHFSNKTLEYLRHNLPWDILISRQTNHLWPSYSQDLFRLTIFWRGTWKTEFVKEIHRQERVSSEKKSDGFHSKCSIELWTILMFELHLCCHTAARCMERT